MKISLRLMIRVHSKIAYWILFNNSEMMNVHLPNATWLDFYPTADQRFHKGLIDMADVIFGCYLYTGQSR